MDKTQELVDLTKKLISFKTTANNPERLKACKDFIKDYFKNLHIEEFEKNNVYSLYISYDGNKEPTLLLNGHFDVVEADKEEFQPYEKDGRIYGRGSWDMKAGIATCMIILKDFSDTKPSVGLLLTGDEEIGGENGMGHAMAQGIRGSLVLASEQNKSEDPTQFHITDGEKGILWVKLTTTGKSCHGSMPWKGENAIENMLDVLNKVRELFPKTTSQDRWRTTVNIGKIQAGDSPNKVPDHAECILDIRFTEKEPEQHIMEKLQSLKVELELIQRGSMVHNDENNPFILKLREAAQTVTGKPSELVKTHGASDIRFAADVGIPAIMCGTSGANMHGKGEYVEIESIKLFYDVLEEFIRRGIKTQ